MDIVLFLSPSLEPPRSDFFEGGPIAVVTISHSLFVGFSKLVPGKTQSHQNETRCVAENILFVAVHRIQSFKYFFHV